MNESTFQSLVRRALGDPDVPAYLRSHVRQAVNQSAETKPSLSKNGLAALAATLVAILVVAALLAPRLFSRVAIPVSVPSPSASPPVSSPAPDPKACRLPIVINNSTDRQVTLTAGFLNVGTGRFTPDPNVTFDDLPHNPYLLPPGTQVHGPVELGFGSYYDPVVRRWLPTSLVSPDRLSYTYPIRNPSTSELHVYDLASHHDRTVWTFAGAVYPFRWTVEGIYATDAPGLPDDVLAKYWRVDPASGQATEVDLATANPYASVINGPGAHGVTGSDPEKALYSVGGRNPGTPYTDFVIVNGQRTDIYSGVNGDQMDFDPINVQFDGQRLWFSNYDDKYVWTWTAETGLTRYPVQIPGTPNSAGVSLTYTIAGPCS